MRVMDFRRPGSNDNSRGKQYVLRWTDILPWCLFDPGFVDFRRRCGGLRPKEVHGRIEALPRDRRGWTQVPDHETHDARNGHRLLKSMTQGKGTRNGI